MIIIITYIFFHFKGDVPTNKRNVEVQIMNRFIRDNHVINLKVPEGVEEYVLIKEGLADLVHNQIDRGTLNEIQLIDIAQRAFWASRNFDPQNQACWTDERNVVFPRNLIAFTMAEQLHGHLKNMYFHLYPEVMENENFVVPRSAWRTNEVFRDGKDIFAGKESRSFKSSFILACWSQIDGTIASFDAMPTKPTPGQIIYFLKHTVFLGNNSKTHIIAYVSWFLDNEELKDFYGSPVEVWHHTLRRPFGAASFIPLRRIASKFVNVKKCMNGHNVIVVLPRKKCIGY